MKVARCLKLVATFYSFLTLSGGATAGFGIWSQISPKTSEVFKTIDGAILTMTLSMGAPMLIALGCIFTLMGLIGFCGTLKKNSWMLLVFFVVVLIIFILQVILAVFILLSKSVKENVFSSLEVKLVESLQNNYGQEDSPVTSIWNETMTKLDCCGYKGYDDFTNSPFVKRNSEYPKQCCSKDSNSRCEKQEAMNKKVEGCFHVLLNENIPISGALLFLIGILQIVALLGSLKVYRCLRRLPDLPDPF